MQWHAMACDGMGWHAMGTGWRAMGMGWRGMANENAMSDVLGHWPAAEDQEAQRLRP